MILFYNKLTDKLRIYRVDETQTDTEKIWLNKFFKLTQENEKTVEKVIIDENIHYIN